MAPVATLFTTVLALAATVDAAPNPLNVPLPAKKALTALWKRYYYGDARGLARPGPLMEKRDALPPGWTSSGCSTESSHQRLLQGFSFSSHANSPTVCLNECAKRGFTIAGTEFGDECYCGSEFVGTGGVVVPDSYCSVPCAGDKSSNCGAAWYLSLYKYNSTIGSSCNTTPPVPTTTTTTTPVPTPTTTTTGAPTPTFTTPGTWGLLGCTTDNTRGARLLTGFAQNGIQNLTPTTCQQTCADKGYSYAGVEYGTECYCSNSLPSTVKYDPSLCTTPCTGDSSINCGGPWVVQVYQKGGDGNIHIVVPTTTTTVPPVVPTTNTPAIPQSGQQHYVWAHHMVGNTFTYFQSDWEDDMRAAKSQGIDGFALNMGSEFWEPNHVQTAYRAAEVVGDFKLFMSLDMSSLRCGSPNDASSLVNLIQSIGSSSAQARINGKVLVSTFAGETCNFGTGSVVAWKTQFKDPLAASGLPVYFIPAFFGEPSAYASYDWLDGQLNWNSGWPQGSQDISAGSTDDKYLSVLGSKGYMSAVSPFFFTHFGPATWNKNWIYRSDDWLYCTRWEQVIAMRDKSVMTEILTWNDYGESSYIAGIKGMLPITSHQWVDGFDHTGLSILTRYYSTAFKTGSYPAITQDSLTMWSRPHAAGANAVVDFIGRPNNSQWTDDNVYAVVLLTAPATVVLYSGSTSQEFSVPAGLSKLKMPSAAGGMGGAIQRNGATVVRYSSGNAFAYTQTPMTYNFNYFVGSASG
jgi:glucan endo-1,3-alpha-glucosidase